MGGSFHAGVVGDIQGWIDEGMSGEIPEYPDHLPPITADPVVALMKNEHLQKPAS